MTVCSNLARGRLMRLTRLDACGAVVEGANSTVTTEGYVSVTVTPTYQDQEDITQANANGGLCIDDQSDPALRWLDLSMVFCLVNPEIINVLTGDPLVLNDAAPTPEAVGFRIDAAVTGTSNFALELWSGKRGQACDTGGNEEFGYWLMPFVKQGTWGEWVVENGALTLTLTARTSAGSGWGVGPYDVVRSTVTPFPVGPLLTPITETQHLHFETTSAPLPEPACDSTALPVA